MESRLKLILTSAALCFAVLLPFAARIIVDHSPSLRTSSVSEISQLIASRQFSRAYKLLATASAKAEESPALRSFQKAICERGLGMPERAYVNLTRLLGAEPLLDDYRRLWMARSLQQMGDEAAATAAYEDLLLSSNMPAVLDSARLYVATLYTASKRFGLSLELYRHQLERNAAQAPELLFRIARIHDIAGQPREAEEARLELMEKYPARRPALDALPYVKRGKGPRKRHARGLVYLEHGRQRQAIREFSAFLKAYPDHELAEDVQYLLARAQLKQGQYRLAWKTFEKVHERYAQPAALYRIGGIQVRLDRDSDAVATYARLVELYPDDDLAHKALWQAAKSAERHNNFEAAAELYLSLADGYPNTDYSDEARWSVAFMQYCLGNYDSALRLFRETATSAQEPHIIDQSLFWAGKLSRRLELEDEADELFAEAADGFPRSYYSTRAVSLGYGPDRTLAEIQLALGIGVVDSENSTWNAAADIAGADHLKRADLLLQLGLRGHAEMELLNAEKLNSGDTEALRVIRDCYETLGILNRALVLTTKIVATNEDEDDIFRLYPGYYWEQIVAAAREADVDPYLVVSVMRQESFFNKLAVSRAGAVGLMQIMPQTGRRIARSMGVKPFDRRLLFDPDTSIRFGSRYLGDQVKSFMAGSTSGIGLELGLAAYNAGPHIARQWLERFPHKDADAFVERIPYKETRLYVKKVLRNYTIYKTLLGA